MKQSTDRTNPQALIPKLSRKRRISSVVRLAPAPTYDAPRCGLSW